MAKDRSNPQNLANPELTQVQAQPVSTLYAPPVSKPAEGNSLMDLGRALAHFEPGLNQFLDNRQAEYTDAQMQAGREAQLKNKADFKVAVNSGAIPAGSSPWFVKGYQQQEQRINGLSFDQTLRESWAKSPIKESDDPQAFKSWMQTFTSHYVEDNQLGGTPQFDVFAKHVEASQSNLYSQHVAFRQQDIENKVILNTGTEIGNVLDYPLIYQGSDGQAAAIKHIVDAQVQNGLNATKANQIAVDAVITHAEANLDLTSLTILNKTEFGSGPVSKTQYARDKIAAAEDNIARNLRQRATMGQAKQEDLVKISSTDMARETFSRALADPSSPIDDILTKANGIDPAVVEAVLKARKQASNYKTDVVEDPQTVIHMMTQALNDPSFERLPDDAHTILTVEHAASINQLINTRRNNPEILRGGWVEHDQSQLESAIVNANGEQATSTFNGPNGTISFASGTAKRTPAVNQKVLAAQSMYLGMLQEALAPVNGKAPGLIELQTKMTAANALILKRYTPNAEGTSPADAAAAPVKPMRPQDDPEFLDAVRQMLKDKKTPPSK